MKIYKEKHIRYGFAYDTDGWFMKKGPDAGKPYIGPICQHFGKTYGTDVMNAQAERDYELYKGSINTSDFGKNTDTIIQYDKLKPQYAKLMEWPKEYVHILTQKEIDKGEYSRYFVQYQDVVYEVNKRMWKFYSSLKTPYHNAIYHAEIKMSLSVFAIDKNKAEINKAAKIMPGVMLKIFPHDNMDIAENLETDGGDLQYDNGDEYIGPYHIHPQNGPMVGARHTSKPHAYLYWQTKEQYRPEGLVSGGGGSGGSGGGSGGSGGGGGY